MTVAAVSMNPLFLRSLFRGFGAFCLSSLVALAFAAPPHDTLPMASGRPGHIEQPAIGSVMERAREAARKKTYVGTFVVLSANGAMASSRIWHLSDAGGQQFERMESLTGTPRTVFRRNDEITTYLPETRVARSERRDSFGLFPHLPRVPASALGTFYAVHSAGSERVAGFDTDVVQLMPRDGFRYGYRLWVERKTGFAVQLQTVDRHGHLIEQAAFSDLQFDVPLRADKMQQQAVGNTGGWQIEKLQRIRTSAEAEGWLVRGAVPGFEPMDCYRRSADAPVGAVQWIFSDGLATVSLFIEPYGKEPRQEWRSVAGTTQLVGRRIGSDWWVTAMGEVPAPTLDAFAASLERRP
ncbi:transcriptional regulator [Xylophilus sp. Kf1]|nr:transcriptional regulator [Xylophilus sp. Kf1]